MVALPLLGRIPKPNRRLQKADQIVMLTEPRSIAAEPVRKLRTNLEFLNLDRNLRTILFTSSIQREGKSTTVANLAVALARAGRRVALVDLDLRRPYLNRFFRLPPSPGITDVALGRYELSAALSQVPIPAPEAQGGRGDLRGGPVRSTPTNGNRRLDAFLTLLPAGRTPPDAGEFCRTPPSRSDHQNAERAIRLCADRRTSPSGGGRRDDLERNSRRHDRARSAKRCPSRDAARTRPTPRCMSGGEAWLCVGWRGARGKLRIRVRL